MSEKDLNEELKRKNQLNNTTKSKDANQGASSFSQNENQSQILSKQELLKKIEQESRGVIEEDRVIINHRAKKANQSTQSSGLKNTRKQVPAETAKPSPSKTNSAKPSSTDLNMNNLSPELQAQFAQFLQQANNKPNFNNFNPNNFNNFNPNAFNFPNFNPGMPNFNPNDFAGFNQPNFNDFNQPMPGVDFDPNFNPNFDANLGEFEQPQEQTEQNVEVNEPISTQKAFKPTPPPQPKKPITPKPKQDEQPKVEKLEAEIEELPEQDIPTLPEVDLPTPIDEIEEIENIEEIPSIEEIPQEPIQEQPAPQNQPNGNQNPDFNFATQIPESEQKDIRALVDIRLEQNTDEIIAATNLNDMGATLGQAAEDLIGNKMKRNVKGWLIALVALLIIALAVGLLWDTIFPKKINQEQAAGLTINIVPSEGDKGSLDAKYIFYPGSEIKFQNGVRIGSELYRTEIREDGTEIQEENEAFAFRFRFFLEFTDEPGIEYTELIESITIPDEIQNTIKYDEVTGYYYYYALVYPGEKYIAFANSIIIDTGTLNEFQGREFQIVLDYSTIVPSSMDAMLGPEGMPDAPADWQESVVFEFEQWAQG